MAFVIKLETLFSVICYLFHCERQRQQKRHRVSDGLRHLNTLKPDEKRQNQDGGNEENTLPAHR